MTYSDTTSTRARGLLVTLVAVLLSLVACGGQQAINDTADQSTIRPAPITTASGQQCQPWVNNPGEADGTGVRPCDYPIPTDRPVRQPGMSDADWFLLGALFATGLGHHDYYYSDNYYRYHIAPAWNRHPGSYYGYGHRPIVRITNYSTTINHVNTTYAADEKKAVADPKTSTYKSAAGKTYNGKTVPPTVFKGSNVTPTEPAGSAKTSTTQTKTSTSGSSSTGVKSNGGTGSGSYTKPSNSTSGRSSSNSSSGHSSSSSSSSSSHSSGGHH